MTKPIKLDLSNFLKRKRNVFALGIITGCVLSSFIDYLEERRCANLYYTKECVNIWVPRFTPIGGQPYEAPTRTETY